MSLEMMKIVGSEIQYVIRRAETITCQTSKALMTSVDIILRHNNLLTPLIRSDSMSDDSDGSSAESAEWSGAFNPFEDPDEKRVLFGALDSFRYDHKTTGNLPSWRCVALSLIRLSLC